MAAYTFWTALIIVALAALRYGDRSARMVACAYVLAALASGLLWPAIGRYRHVEWTVFVVDLLLAVFLVTVALDIRRWWVVCASVLQIVTVLGHVAKAIKPDIWPLAYAWMMQASSFPSLLALAGGIAASHRQQNRPAARGWSVAGVDATPGIH